MANNKNSKPKKTAHSDAYKLKIKMLHGVQNSVLFGKYLFLGRKVRDFVRCFMRDSAIFFIYYCSDVVIERRQ